MANPFACIALYAREKRLATLVRACKSTARRGRAPVTGGVRTVISAVIVGVRTAEGATAIIDGVRTAEGVSTIKRPTRGTTVAVDPDGECARAVALNVAVGKFVLLIHVMEVVPIKHILALIPTGDTMNARVANILDPSFSILVDQRGPYW